MMDGHEAVQKVELVRKDDEVVAAREAKPRKRFVDPQLTRHASLPRVTSGIAFSITP